MRQPLFFILSDAEPPFQSTVTPMLQSYGIQSRFANLATILAPALNRLPSARDLPSENMVKSK